MGIGAGDREVRLSFADLPKVGTCWYQPYAPSPEFVLGKDGIRVGEVYPSCVFDQDGEWVARLYPHDPRTYNSQHEAMLYLEAIAALT